MSESARKEARRTVYGMCVCVYSALPLLEQPRGGGGMRARVWLWMGGDGARVWGLVV